MEEAIQELITNLEFWRLIILALIPISVVIIGFLVNKRLKKFEHIQWTNQKMIDKKFQIYDELVPKLNDILCYFTYIGSWKKFKPYEIIELKRDIDKIVYVYSPLFPTDFLTKYNEFMDNCFDSYSGWGNDAKIRSSFSKRKEINDNWETVWDKFFVDENKITSAEVIKVKYINFVKFFAKEINVGMNFESINSGEIPNSMKLKC